MELRNSGRFSLSSQLDNTEVLEELRALREENFKFQEERLWREERERELLSEIATLRVDLAFEKDRTSNQEELRQQMLKKLFAKEHDVQGDLLDLRHDYDAKIAEGEKREARYQNDIRMYQTEIKEERARIEGYMHEASQLRQDNLELKMELRERVSDVHMLRQQIEELQVELDNAKLTAAASPLKLASPVHRNGPTSLSQPGGVVDDGNKFFASQQDELPGKRDSLQALVDEQQVLIELLHERSYGDISENRKEMEDMRAYAQIAQKVLDALSDKAKFVGLCGVLVERTDWSVRAVVDAMHSWPDKKFKESIQVTPTDVTSTDVVAPEEPGFDGLPSMWRVR